MESTTCRDFRDFPCKSEVFRIGVWKAIINGVKWYE